jgi:hypothetical protein
LPQAAETFVSGIFRHGIEPGQGVLLLSFCCPIEREHDMYATIYHPRFEPDGSWLRAMLLFYDTVHSIVPGGAGYKASPGVARLQDKAPGAFIPLPPDIEDRAVFSAEDGVWNRYFALSAFFDDFTSAQAHWPEARAIGPRAP